jgi:FkbM family methyltransferase
VIAIEPGPATFARLQANLALNPELQSYVHAHALGLSDQPGHLFWQEDANVPGNAGLLAGQGQPVEVTTLDQLAQDLTLERLDFVKIDVEGMEYEVMKGGKAVIVRFRPILYYETLESFRQGRGFDLYNQIFDLLHGLQYRQFCILPGGKLSEVHDLNILNSPNTLAIPTEKLSQGLEHPSKSSVRT